MSQGKNKVSQKDMKYQGRIKWNLKTGLSVQMKTTLEILKTGYSMPFPFSERMNLLNEDEILTKMQ